MAEKDMDDTEDKDMILDEECDCEDKEDCNCDDLPESDDEDKKDDEEMIDESDDEDEEEDEKTMMESLAKVLGLKASSIKKLTEAVNGAVSLKLKAKEKILEAALRKEALEAVRIIAKKMNENMESKLNAYSKIVVKEWLKENKISIAGQIELKRAKNISEGIRKLMKENDLEVDAEEKDIIDDLEDSLADEKNENIALVAKNKEYRKILESVAKKEEIASYGLTNEAAEKVFAVVESFPVDKNLKNRIKTIVELTSVSAKPARPSMSLTEKTKKPLAQKLTESFQARPNTNKIIESESDFIRNLLK